MTLSFTINTEYVRSLLSKEEVERRFSEQRVKLELIDSIKEDALDGEYLFPLAEIMKQYNNRRGELGLAAVTRGTNVKKMILEAFDGDMEERGEGNQPKILAFSEGLNILIKDVLKKRQVNQDMKVISECAKVIREDIFNHKGFCFSGNFSEECQTQSIPISLRVLMSLIITTLAKSIRPPSNKVDLLAKY